MHRDYDGSERVLVPGTLRGYRAWVKTWHVQGRNGSLSSLNLWHGWSRTNSVVAADCGAGWSHSAPSRGCSCGIYASYRPKGYADMLARAPQFSRSDFVHGCIRAHGRIILGTAGFRAQRVEMEAIYGRGNRVIASNYNVPWFATLGELLEHFPPSSVDALLESK